MKKTDKTITDKEIETLFELMEKFDADIFDDNNFPIFTFEAIDENNNSLPIISFQCSSLEGATKEFSNFLIHKNNKRYLKDINNVIVGKVFAYQKIGIIKLVKTLINKNNINNVNYKRLLETLKQHPKLVKMIEIQNGKNINDITKNELFEYLDNNKNIFMGEMEKIFDNAPENSENNLNDFFNSIEIPEEYKIN